MTPAEQLRAIILGYRQSQAVHVAAVLGISDLVADGPRTVEDLAAAADADVGALRRLLQALAAVGVYVEDDKGQFANTELSRALCTGVPGSLNALATYFGEPTAWAAWGHLLHSARTGENAFTALHGTDVWTHREQHPEMGVVFDTVMAANTTALAGALAGAYNFSDVGTVADIGGGYGVLLEAVLTAHPHLSGVLFEQPHVVAGAELALAHSPIRDRCQLVAGSMFDSVPAGADAYLFKAILHDWVDEEVEKILRVCRDTMSDTAVVLIVERLLEGPNLGAEAKFSDLNMLVMPGGLERSEAEFAALLERSGLRLRRTLPTASVMYVLEAVKA
jgi:hypothetical protein